MAASSRSKKPRRAQGRHRKQAKRQPGNCAHWLRIGAVTAGLTAAIASGQGVAVADSADTAGGGGASSASSGGGDSDSGGSGGAAGETRDRGEASGSSDSGAAASSARDTAADPEPTGFHDPQSRDEKDVEDEAPDLSSSDEAQKSPQDSAGAEQEPASEQAVATGSDRDTATGADEPLDGADRPIAADDPGTSPAQSDGSDTRKPEGARAAVVTAAPEALDSGAEPGVSTTESTAALGQVTTTPMATFAATAVAADSAVPQGSSTSTSTSAVPAAAAPAAAGAPVTLQSIIGDVLTWVGLGALANGLPVPAVPVPVFESLWFGVRELMRTLNNQRPGASPSSGQGLNGLVTGSLNAADFDGDTLTFTVLADPSKGTVVVDSQGGFVYTPGRGLAAHGGQDSFTVVVDDHKIHGLAGLLGLAGPATVNVTVTVTPFRPAGNDTPEAGDPGYHIAGIDLGTGIATGSIYVTDPEGDQLSYAISDGVDPDFGSVSIDTAGVFIFTPTALVRYRAATTDQDEVTFTVTASDGWAGGLNIVVSVPVSPLHPDDDGVLDKGELDALVSLGVVGAATKSDGTIIAIVGAFTDDKVRNPAEALQELNRIAGLLGVTGQLSGEIRVLSTEFENGSGGVPETVYRLAQTVNGVPVLGSEVTLAVLIDGTPTGAFSGIDPAVYRVDTTAAQSIDDTDEAIAAAMAILLGGMADAPNGDQLQTLRQSLAFDPRLVIVALDPDVAPVLAWLIDVHTASDAAAAESGAAGVSTGYYIYANGAQAGQLLALLDGAHEAYSPTTVTAAGLPVSGAPQTHTITVEQDGTAAQLIDEARNITVYNAGTRNVDIGSGRTQQQGVMLDVVVRGASGWDPSAVSAMHNIAVTYDYYKALGWDFADHYLDPANRFYNRVGLQVGVVSNLAGGAQWNPNLQTASDSTYGLNFTFGLDTEAALDVVAHEYTHAVVQSIVNTTSGFTGGQGAALEESYGDIIGHLVENKQGTDAWLFGEDAVGNPFRDMANPSNTAVANPGPGYYSQNSITEAEAHRYASIVDRAAYLMMTDPRTASVSNETWARIFYTSLTRLPTNATFQNTQNAVVAAASVQGLDAAAQRAIVEAFAGVGISSSLGVTIV